MALCQVLDVITCPLNCITRGITKFAPVFQLLSPKFAVVFAAVSALINLAAVFLPPQESAELQFMKAAFDEVFLQLEVIERKVSSLLPRFI